MITFVVFAKIPDQDLYFDKDLFNAGIRIHFFNTTVM